MRTSDIDRMFVGALFAFVSACGGGGADNSALASKEAESGLVMKSDPVQTLSATLPTVSAGFNVAIYANVNQPMKLSFGSDGVLYVGRQGGNDRIHRVAPGGALVSEFGPAMVDPDAVLFDAAGVISGTPGSVLVGGEGVIAVISPSQTATVVFNSGFDDADDMKFDHTGRGQRDKDSHSANLEGNTGAEHAPVAV